ncbi:MAG: hypothetical protein SWH61_17370 [Thermodesulfobacteriota bacterium]|nr:hypothetical protein [Thermodesulfobacteriota bacterium]
MIRKSEDLPGHVAIPLRTKDRHRIQFLDKKGYPRIEIVRSGFFFALLTAL